MPARQFSLTAGENAAPMQLASAGHGNQRATRSDPNAVIPIQRFIRYVREVESAYPDNDTRGVVTRIRQEYYRGIAFDQLIPNAPRTDIIPRQPVTIYDDSYATYVPARLERNRLSAETYNALTSNADENAIGDNPSPYILLDNGEKIDLGHMLLGLDALLNPGTGQPYAAYDVPSIDPSSWAADVGIAAVWMEKHERDGRPHGDAPVKLDAPDFDAYYRMSAPTEDLLGDVDSFGMMETAGRNANEPLSVWLQKYYLGQGREAARINNRWETFCRMNGITYSMRGGRAHISNRSYEYWIARINRFNDLYGAGMLGAAGGTIASVVREPARFQWKWTGTSLRRFFDFVETRLSAELRR